jgi:hypothetical protein
MLEQCTLTTTAASSSKLLLLGGLSGPFSVDAGCFSSATSGKMLGNYFELHDFNFLQYLFQIIIRNHPVI